MRLEVYRRPNKPATMPVKKRNTSGRVQPVLSVTEPLIVDCSTECHVTPPELANRMTSYLGDLTEAIIAEPQAGTGNLIQAVLDTGEDFETLTAIEKNVDLYIATNRRFSNLEKITVQNGCFLVYAEGRSKRFTKIIMNPPFRTARQHINAALSMLDYQSAKPCTLVACVPVTYQHPDCETVETLSNEVFVATKVNAKIIRFEF